LRGRLCYFRLETPAVETVEPEVTAIEANVTAIVADFNAVVADIPAVGERCLGLGSNSGKEEANGEHYGKLGFHKSSFICCELNIELAYRKGGGRNCLSFNRYTYVKTN
jgi:hypothetical protein